MEEVKYHRDPPAEDKTPRRKSGQNQTRAPSHGRKLKNESSAKQAAGRKLRFGKEDHVMSPEEKRKLLKKKAAHQKAVKAEFALSRVSHKAADEANEDQNAGTEALNRGIEAGESAASAAEDHLYSKKLKSTEKALRRAELEAEGGTINHDGVFRSPGKNMKTTGNSAIHVDNSAESANFMDKSDTSGFTGKYSDKLGRTAKSASEKTSSADSAVSSSKVIQKNRMKKEFQRAANQKFDREAANSFGSIGRKFVDKAEDIGGKIGEWIEEHLAEHPMALLIALVILIVVLLIAGSSSGGNLLMNLFGGSTVASSYTAEDSDILAVNQNYKDLEAGLQKKIDNIKNDYPGYDEYRITLAEIGHDPYDLAALLTVLYEDYTPDEVQGKLQEIFDQQYKLTTKRIVETRTRTVTKTGHHTVTHEDGTTSREKYTYTVEEEYKYYILKVTLENKSLGTVIQNLHLTDDQLERYNLLKETYGNKKYLFGDDIYANPDADGGGSGGTGGSAGVTYEPSGEALSDSQFAAMWQEASKYLGRAYVWGGSSPSTGFDCSGFVCWVINQSGVGHIGRTTAEGIRQWCDTIPKSERQPGDISFFQGTYDTPGASHVGIYIGDGKMIHCGDPIKVSNVDSGYFAQHFLCYGRIPR